MAVHVGEHRISLDKKEKDASINFVSHAHSDHTGGVKKSSKVLCSEITRDLIETRVGFQVNMAEKPESVELIDSGHMLGSKQLYAELGNGLSMVYTGDYQMQKSPVAESIEVRNADILIIDSTYPFPNIVFDEKEEVITSMQHYIQNKGNVGSILFGAYSMGKAQELIRICNDIGIVPLVDESVARISDVYSKHGIGLEFVTQGIGSKIEDGCFDSQVWISSMNGFDDVRGMVSQMGRKIFTAVATGFARMHKFNTDVQFTLSDHADFKQAINYIECCNPKFIYTRGSGSYAFAKNLKAAGYRAEELKPDFDARNILLNCL